MRSDGARREAKKSSIFKKNSQNLWPIQLIQKYIDAESVTEEN